MEIKNLAVFCGSSAGSDAIYIENAEKLGKELADENSTLIYGGAQVGCMRALANTSLNNGARGAGVIPIELTNDGSAHDHLTELHVVNTMHERKAKMAEMAERFIALPGGGGTLEESFEVFT